jgi:hypothetical protein
MKYKSFVIFSAAIIGFFSSGPAALAGFGISPASITNDRLLPGMSFEQTITVVRGPDSAGRKQNINVEIKGVLVDKWITLAENSPLTMPTGVTKLPLKFKITVPDSATLGKYSGSISINSVPADLAADTKGSSARPLMSAQARVALQVIDKQITDFRIEALNIPKVETGEPVMFEFRINNSGNTEVFLDKVHVDIAKYDNQQETLQKVDFTKFETAAPFEIQNFSEKLTAGLEPGLYAATAMFFQDGKQIEKKVVGFDVVEKGNVLAGGLPVFRLDKSRVKGGETVTAIAQFKNSSIKTVSARLVIAVADENGGAAKNFETAEIEVQSGDTAEFRLPFIMDSYGKYSVTGYIEYNGRTTASAREDLRVDLTVKTILLVIVASAIGLACLAVFIRLFVKMAAKK